MRPAIASQCDKHNVKAYPREKCSSKATTKTSDMHIHQNPTKGKKPDHCACVHPTNRSITKSKDSPKNYQKNSLHQLEN